MQNFRRQVTFKFHRPRLSKIYLIVVLWIRELGNSKTFMNIYLTSAMVFDQIHLCIDIFILFKVTVSTL